MEMIEAYKATDGKLFEREIDCQVHQENLTRRKRIKKFTDKHCFSGMTSSDVFDLLYTNATQLRGILK